MAKDNTEIELDDYVFLENMDTEAWAWEFTRRKKAYQKLCKIFFSPVIKTPDNDSDPLYIRMIDEKEVQAAAKFGLLFFRRPRSGF